MGWSFGKSIRVIGNFLRLNISARGIGFSIGIRGARVSHGPRGTQVNVGRHGFRYRKTLAKTPERPQPQPGLAEAPAMGQPLHRAIDIDLLDATKPTESIENTNRLLSAARNRIVQESKPVWIAAAVKECSRRLNLITKGKNDWSPPAKFCAQPKMQRAKPTPQHASSTSGNFVTGSRIAVPL